MKKEQVEREIVSGMLLCVLRPNNASTCWPIGFDHTDDDDDVDDDEPLERGGKSGGFWLPLLLSTVIFVAPPLEFDPPCADRFEWPTKLLATAPDADCPLLCSFSARNCVT